MVKSYKRFIARRENFGLTVYDRNFLKPLFLTKDEAARFISENEVEIINNTPFVPRKDIIYSPIRVFFEMTLACNLRCKTCLNNSGIPLEDELSLEQSIQVIEGLKRDSIFDIKFTGGEPTQKPGWDIILQRAKDLGLIVTINSNGIYTPDQVRKLIMVQPDEISVSLDGYGASNDSIRGKGNFEKAAESIKELKAAGCRVTINSVVTSFMTKIDIRNLLAFANEYCHSISFFHARPIGRAASMKDQLLGYEKLNHVMELIEKLKQDYPRTDIQTRSHNLRKNSLRRSQIESLGLQEGGPDGFTRFNLLSNGDMYAGGCVPYVQGFKDLMKLGNILSEGYSLLMVWRFSKKLDRIREWSSKLQRQCDSCEDYEKKCQGFTLDMELYRKTNPNGNIYCKR